MKGDELAEVMADTVNSGINSDNLQETIQREHPYLQAEMVNQVLIPALKAIAETSQVDARNERAVARCEELLAGLSTEV